MQVAAAVALACIPGSVEAQDRDKGSDVIIVEGNHQVTVSDLRRQARSITPRAGWQGEPLPRVQHEICAGVWGLERESAQLIIDRIYYNAEQIGLPVTREPGCIANFVVAVVADPRADFAKMRDIEFKLVEGLDLWERKRVAAQEGPVLAWNAIAAVSNSGVMALGNPPVFETTLASRLQSATRTEIELSVMLIAADAIADKDGVAVADYVTMRGLARKRPPPEKPIVPTILSLFSPDDTAPGRMTDYDRAYLAALYEIRESVPMYQAMGQIGSMMRKAMAEVPGEGGVMVEPVADESLP